jgi:CubicO group peptidase (beta-lactamase class C family)
MRTSWFAVATAALVAGTLVVATPAAAAAGVDPLPRATPESVGMSTQKLALIGDTMRADVANGRIPGAVVAIARKGKLVYFEAFGYVDRAAGTPMTTDAIFNIASMTKPMVASGALMLFEQGQVLMDDPVSKYLPGFATKRVAVMNADKTDIVETVSTARQITVQDLMRHTSGLVYGGRGNTAVHKLYPGGSDSASAMSSHDFLDKMVSAPLLWQPGTVWDYGFSIDVLGLVVEQVSKQSLGQYLKEHLWKPLGMNDTGFSVTGAAAKRYARPLATDPDTGKPQSALDLTKPLGFECGGGCSASTAGDYLRFTQMLLNHGTLEGHRVLGRKTVEFMLSNQLGPDMKNLIGAADPTRADYGFGLGLAVRTTPGVVRLMGSVGDFSWPGASGTNWWGDPKEELAVVFMSAAPGPLRWHYRQLVNALVYQAIAD